MSQIVAKWIVKDPNSLEDDNGNLAVKLDGAGGLDSSGSGVKIGAAGVTNAMLAGSIALSKLAEPVLQADGGQAATGDLDMGGNQITNLGAGVANTDAVTKAQLDAAIATPFDYLPDVLDIQVDNTLDPGATPAEGDRYIITDSGNLHANFGTITGIGDFDIVEWQSTEFVVVFDASVAGAGAMAYVTAAGDFYQYDGVTWAARSTAVVAGGGLTLTGNQLDVVGAANSAITVNANDIAVSVDNSTIEIAAGSPGTLRIKDGGVTSAKLAFSIEARKVEMHKITSGEVTTGYFALAETPVDPAAVTVDVVSGIRQVNKQAVGATGVTPDFDVLSSTQLHISNNGGATGLSGELVANTVLIITYSYAV